MCPTHLELIRHHVAQALVVHQADVDVTWHLLARHAADHRLLAVLGKASSLQLLAKLLYRVDALLCLCALFPLARRLAAAR